MINRFLLRKKEPPKRETWGLWCDPKLHLSYKLMAAQLRVPVCVLVSHVLRRWLAKNGLTLLQDKAKRAAFADRLAERYLVPPGPNGAKPSGGYGA